MIYYLLIIELSSIHLTYSLHSAHNIISGKIKNNAKLDKEGLSLANII